MASRQTSFLLFAVALTLSGCGSSSTRPSVATPRADGAGATTTSAPVTPRRGGRGGASAVTTPTTPASAPATGGTPAPSGASSHTGVGLAGARGTLEGQGYRVADSSAYESSQTLRVLVGIGRGSADARVQRAFFFSGERYLGTDTSTPSASVRVVSHDDTGVTLSYALYRHDDPLCCPTGGHARVRFALDNGRLSALDPIPSADPGAALSRR
ncbi:MAG TPA: LppP/LprE family lipoprotein [Solirubrobacteraceae bacterium]|nr:LppP/LprE family lipoprotein [Solirubrobacteraceae bacterium]